MLEKGLKKIPRIDWRLLLPVTILISVSLVTLLSLNPFFFQSQLISVLIALAAFFFFSQINIHFLKPLRLYIYIFSLILLVVTFVIGFESRGATRWVQLFGISVQFSEVLKPLLAISFASFLSEQEHASKKMFFKILVLFAPIFLLVFLQPDLGSALLYLFVLLISLYVYGYPKKWFAFLALPFVMAAPFVWQILHDYQRQRVLTFLNPQADPLGVSYNSIQALIAVGSGAFMGKGLSEGTQSGLRFLPERQTDFIFATIAEGLGFVGSFIIIAAILFLCYRIYTVFLKTSDRFSKIYSIIAFSFILIPAFVNIGMNIGIIPIVGVTLPFVSFGGSSLLSNFIFLGIVSTISTSRKYNEVLEIR